MTTVAIYERVLQLMEAEGVKTLFGIPDPSFFRMFTTAEKRGWKVVAPHHEEAGGFMAEAMWKLTGVPGVVVGNQGPGVANLAPAAICAAKENSPVIFIAGQRQQIADQRVRRGRISWIRQWRHFEAAMKYIGIIEYPEQTDDIIREAFRRAVSGTPGPVFIEIPMDSMHASLDLPPVLAPDKYRLTTQEAGTRAVSSAVELIKDARSPILLVGQGVFAARAHDAVGNLARLLDCPVIQTSGGSSFIRGLEERTFPYCFSPAANDAVDKSDLVIAVGTEIGEPLHHGIGGHWQRGNESRKWIYIERDPLAIGVNRIVDAPLVGDLRDVVPQLLEALTLSSRKSNPRLAGWVDMHRDYRREVVSKLPPDTVPMHTARFVFEATRALPEDAVFVRDGGAVSIFAWTYSQSRSTDLIWSQNFGHLGTGLPYAIGAQLAVGASRRVVLLTGDSAFLFHISELETAVRKQLPIICIVGCDYAWGLEVRGYRGMIGPDTAETEAHWGRQVRLDKTAESFGAYGEYVEHAEDIVPAIQRALASGKPAVIQVPVDPDKHAAEVPGHEEYSTWYTDFF
jgi:thiamine pyrophosphate-dependent acetolactate synthase large subunit-like protein